MASITSLLASALMFAGLIVAAPLHGDVILSTNRRSSTLLEKLNMNEKKARKTKVLGETRRKREIPFEDQFDGDELDRRLAELSDDQLVLLASIVQEELQKYDPNMSPDSYQIVELPEDLFLKQLDNGDDGVYEDAILIPRDERSIIGDEPFIIIPEQQTEQVFDNEEQQNSINRPQVILIPEEDVQQADEEEEGPGQEDEQELEEEEEEDLTSRNIVDDLELSSRIAELAAILNERAYRNQ